MNHLSAPLKLASLGLAMSHLFISSAAGVTFFETDFEAEVVGSAPAAGVLDLSPDSPEANQGVTIVDGASTPASPFGGKSLYIYDLDDGGNVRYVADIDNGDNVSSLQVDFDFAVDPAITGPASSTEINFTVGMAGVPLTSSSRRAFEFRILQDGGLDMRSEGVSTEIGTFSTADTHHMTVLLNSDDAASLDYDADGVGSGTLLPNTFHVYVNGTKLGEYDFFLDPSDEAVAYNTGLPDLGRVAFYQDTGSVGALIVDNLKIQDVETGDESSDPGTVVYSAFDFETDTVGSEPDGFNDNSFTPLDGTDIRVIDGASDPASPLTGQSVYALDSTISDNVRLGGDFNGGDNVDSLHVSFDFSRGPAQAEGERIAFSITHAGLNPTSSSRRPFELRLNEDGSIDMRSGPDAGSLTSTDDIGSFDPAASNTLEMLFNSDDSESLDYDVAVGSGTIPANSFHIYINGSLGGEFALALDPSDGAVDFAAGVPDLGRFAFYQDTNSLGSLIIDDLVFKGIAAPGGGDVDPSLNIYSSLDFESDTVGEQPVVEGASFTPGSNSSTNGAVVVDADSTPVANPLTGQSLYFYDLGTSSGNSTHFRYPFNGGEDVSEVRVDFDFQRGYAVAAEEGDTAMHVGVGRALAGALNNSDFRPFRLSLFNDGSLSVDSLSGTTALGLYDVSNPNEVSLLINSHDSQSVVYDLFDLGAGTLLPNTVHIFLAGSKLGEFDFFVTPDPANAPQIVFNEENNDLGQIAFFQDTNSEGGIAFDNIVISRVNPIGSPPASPSDLAVDSVEARSATLSWTDNSSDESGFLVERKTGASGVYAVVADVNADVTEFEDTGLDTETSYFYRVSSTNGLNSDPTSEVEAVTLEQITPFLVDSMAEDFAVVNGSAEISVTVEGRAPLSYQWYQGASGDTSSPVAGATGAVFNSPALTEDSSFWVRVSNDEGTIDSGTFLVEVHDPVVYEVSTESELEDAIELALPGDEIVVAVGEYPDWQIDFQAEGVEIAPITLRAEVAGEVIFTQESRIEIGGSWLVVDGFAFTGKYSGNDDEVIQFRADTHATDCRLTNVAVIDYIPSDGSKMSYVSMYGQRNRVDNCYFSGHNVPGVTLVVWLDGQPNYHRIDHNHFANRIDGGENGWETIRIGTSDTSMSNSITTVEYNLFTRVDGEIEIISNKSGENIYRYNTFHESRGTLTLRHGDRCLVEGNYFLGGFLGETGGVRVIGRDHMIINNYFEGTTSRDGAAITVYAGVPDSPLNEYFSADRAVIAFNTFYDNQGPLIEIAAGFGERDRTVLPTGIVVANNLMAAGSQTTGDFVIGENAADQTWDGNIIFGRPMGGLIATGFTVADPLLSIDNVFRIARPSEASPVVDAATDIIGAVEIDIDGQDRDASEDVGADEVSSAPSDVSGPLTTMDTGPSYLGHRRILGGGSSRLVNQSVRAYVSPGSGTLIAGFVVRSGGSKSMLIRGVGPGLIDQNVPDAIADPVLTVYNEAGEPIFSNDDWEDENGAAIASAGSDVGAFALEAGSADAAILTNFEPGLYTVHVVSGDASLGEAMLEIYEVSGSLSLANQSARSKREAPEEVSIAGFVIGGDLPKQLLIRGAGPSLEAYGLSDACPDVRIELFNEAGESLLFNDNWDDLPPLVAESIAETADSVGAFPFAAGSKDAAIVTVLEPGLYTIHLTGPNDSVGVSLIEVYDVADLQ